MYRLQPEAEREGREGKISEFPKINGQTDGSRQFKIKVRFDYKGLPRPPRFFFGGKGSREVAEETRKQQTAMWRNVPIQGVRIEDAEFFDLYSVYDDFEDEMIFYAPLELKFAADSLEDCARFICRDEFRRIEILEPVQVFLDSRELERIFYKLSEAWQQKLRGLELK